MMKLRINPIVAEDLKNIKEYIAEDNEEMAVKTIQEIYARIEDIQQFPYMGSDLAKRVSFRTDYKYVICGNYVVLPVLEELGYPKENFFVEKHCRVDKKDLYSDVYIEVDNGTVILVETKKAKKE